MNNVEQFQKHAQEQNEAAMASTNTFAANVKTITTAHAEYTKKAFQDGSEFISKLTSLKSPDEAMKLQADYAKSAYETFVADDIGVQRRELCSDGHSNCDCSRRAASRYLAGSSPRLTHSTAHRTIACGVFCPSPKRISCCVS
jgi:hypothetical protein